MAERAIIGYRLRTEVLCSAISESIVTVGLYPEIELDVIRAIVTTAKR